MARHQEPPRHYCCCTKATQPCRPPSTPTTRVLSGERPDCVWTRSENSFAKRSTTASACGTVPRNFHARQPRRRTQNDKSKTPKKRRLGRNKMPSLRKKPRREKEKTQRGLSPAGKRRGYVAPGHRYHHSSRLDEETTRCWVRCASLPAEKPMQTQHKGCTTRKVEGQLCNMTFFSARNSTRQLHRATRAGTWGGRLPTYPPDPITLSLAHKQHGAFITPILSSLGGKNTRTRPTNHSSKYAHQAYITIHHLQRLVLM